MRPARRVAASLRRAQRRDHVRHKGGPGGVRRGRGRGGRHFGGGEIKRVWKELIRFVLFCQERESERSFLFIISFAVARRVCRVGPSQWDPLDQRSSSPVFVRPGTLRCQRRRRPPRPLRRRRRPPPRARRRPPKSWPCSAARRTHPCSQWGTTRPCRRWPACWGGGCRWGEGVVARAQASGGSAGQKTLATLTPSIFLLSLSGHRPRRPHPHRHARLPGPAGQHRPPGSGPHGYPHRAGRPADGLPAGGGRGGRGGRGGGSS